MNKFKKGDIIKGINKRYLHTNKDMKKAIVTDILSGNMMKIKILDHENKNTIGHFFTVDNTDQFFELISNKEIHITLDDTTTIAILKENGKVVKRSEAKLHPDDTFDFETGVNVVIGRLFNRENISNANADPVADKHLHLKIHRKDLGILGTPVNKTDVFGEQLHVGDVIQYFEKGIAPDVLATTGNAVVISNEELVLFNGDKENIQRRNLPFMLSESYTKRKLGYRYPFTDICVGYLV